MPASISQGLGAYRDQTFPEEEAGDHHGAGGRDGSDAIRAFTSKLPLPNRQGVSSEAMALELMVGALKIGRFCAGSIRAGIWSFGPVGGELP